MPPDELPAALFEVLPGLMPLLSKTARGESTDGGVVGAAGNAGIGKIGNEFPEALLVGRRGATTGGAATGGATVGAVGVLLVTMRGGVVGS